MPTYLLRHLRFFTNSPRTPQCSPQLCQIYSITVKFIGYGGASPLQHCKAQLILSPRPPQYSLVIFPTCRIYRITGKFIGMGTRHCKAQVANTLSQRLCRKYRLIGGLRFTGLRVSPLEMGTRHCKAQLILSPSVCAIYRLIGVPGTRVHRITGEPTGIGDATLRGQLKGFGMHIVRIDKTNINNDKQLKIA